MENYLLVASAIAKVAKIPRRDAEELLTGVIGEQKDEAILALQNQRLEERNRKIGEAGKFAPKTVLMNAKTEFDAR